MDYTNLDELRDFLNEKVEQYNRPSFIEDDPIQIPHLFNKKEDIEISAFLAATIAWGNRKMILKNAKKMMDIMGYEPYNFVMNHQQYDLSDAQKFVHRTFNGEDFSYFIKALRYIYQEYGGLEQIFIQYQSEKSLLPAIHHFKRIFFELPHPIRTEKHVADPFKGSAAKRINMFLRWLVRSDSNGVDLGIWKSLSPACLSCPLDVHSGNVARRLGFISRNQNDYKALLELDANLRLLDAQDPAKYDFALFGLGIFDKWS